MDIGTPNDPQSNSGSDSADYRFADRRETRASRTHVALRLLVRGHVVGKAQNLDVKSEERWV